MSELKTCPFCGSAGREVIRFYEEGAATSIRCQTCKVVTAPFLHIPEAVAAWNTRPGEDKLQARVDALEWLREVEEYAIEHEHPVCTAMGNSSKRGQLFDRAAKEYDSILSAAKAAVEKK